MPGTQTVVLFFVLTIAMLARPASAATETFVYGGCSQLRFATGSTYESNVNSVLSSLVNSATFTSFANITVQGSTKQDTVYGLFQCRGDLQASECSSCVSRAIAQMGTLCGGGACAGALQLEGCFVKYDNASFLGVEDKTLVVKKCGPSIGYDDQEAMTGIDQALGSMGAGGGAYRTGGSAAGDVHGVAQCVGDLSPSECQDCLAEAVGRIRTYCGIATWGDVYLAKCYARYWKGDGHARGSNNNEKKNNDDEVEKTLAIIIGLIAGVILLVIFASFLGKQCQKLQDGK